MLIIGCGVTGAGLARDLALRGVRCVLAEKQDVNAGASGGNHGLLHSGARYVASDPEAARECRDEGQLLKRLAPHCIDDAGGLFVAVEGDREDYIADFPHLCAKSGIHAQPVDVKTAREMEPELSDRLIAAFQVPDASVDPFKLSLDNIAQARLHGAELLCYHQAVFFRIENRRIRTVTLRNTLNGEEMEVEADVVVSASGAWAGIIAGLAGAEIPMIYSKGSLLVTQNRVCTRIINRLRKPSNADILVPGGTVSILGTTSVRTADPDDCRPGIAEVDEIVEEGARMIPVLEHTRYIRAYSGVRPLIGSSGGDDRNVTRGFALIDHAVQGIENFITITGGKLTTFRLMAEKTADMVCQKLGVSAPCKTAADPLSSSDSGQWTEPGLAPKMWLTKHASDDLILCECEMVSKGIIDGIIDGIREQGGTPTLKSVGLRSRIGKGPCQGGFCSARIAPYLYDRKELSGDRGLKELRDFLNERWKGKYPMLWDLPLEQAEIQEALHCGLFGLEL